MNEYLSVWDIAKRRDFTAGFTIRRSVEIVQGNEIIHSPDRVRTYCDIVQIEQFNNIPYTRVADIIENRMGHKDLRHSCDLIVDGTGIGSAVVDLLREKSLKPIPIVFTSGGKVQEVVTPFGQVFKNSPGQLAPLKVVQELRVPKNDLVAAGKLLLEQNRVRVAPGLRWGDEFKKQLAAFKGKVNEKGRTKYEAETEDDHDDMVVCYLMAAWWILRGGTQDVERVLPTNQSADDWEPADYL